MAMQWLAHSKKALVSNLLANLGFSVCSVHVVPLPVWVYSPKTCSSHQQDTLNHNVSNHMHVVSASHIVVLL